MPSNDPDLERLKKERAKTMTNEQLVEECEMLHEGLHKATSEALAMEICLKKIKRYTERLSSLDRPPHTIISNFELLKCLNDIKTEINQCLSSVEKL